MSDRAVSSILDVTICLLLVTASAVTLAGVPGPQPRESPDRSDAILDLLATSTAWVEYDLDGVPAGDEPAGRPNQTTHGTLAGLLAASAVANATAHGESVGPGASDFRRAVASEVRTATARQDVQVQVVAHWVPYPGSHVRGRAVVGPSPPRDSTIHAASATVPWRSSDARSRAESTARRGGFPAVAGIVAETLIRGPLAPRDRLGDPGWDEGVAVAYGLPTADDQDPDALRRAVADAVETDLRNRFDSPVVAARSLTTGEVRLTVRTWSP